MSSSGTFTLEKRTCYPMANVGDSTFRPELGNEIGLVDILRTKAKFYAAAEYNEEFDEIIRKTSSGSLGRGHLENYTCRGAFIDGDTVSLLFCYKHMGATEMQSRPWRVEKRSLTFDGEENPAPFAPSADNTLAADCSDLGCLQDSVLATYNGSAPQYFKLRVKDVDAQLVVAKPTDMQMWKCTKTGIHKLWSVTDEKSDQSTTFWLKERDA